MCADWREREAYVCGPESLIEVLEAHWRTAGRDAHLHRERFRAPRAAVPADAAGGRVRFARSGTAIDADAGTSLLEAAERAGLRPAHGCRMGICHSCTATLRAGCARDLRSNATIAEPGARVQICVAAASGDVEIDL